MDKPRLSMNELKDLVEQSKNEELQSILQTANKPFDWVFDDGTTLLHLAVVHDNLQLIEYLLNTAGHDVDAKNSSGDTALITALRHNNFAATRVLLDADADLRVADADGKTALAILMTWNRYEEQVVEDNIPYFLDNLKRSKFEAETTAELLAAAGCPLEYAWLTVDVEVVRGVLNRDTWGWVTNQGLHRAMNRMDRERIEFILRSSPAHGPMEFGRSLDFFYPRRFDSCRVFFEIMDDFDVACQPAMAFFSCLFNVAEPSYVRSLLDWKVHLPAKRQLGIDVRSSIFVNKQLDAIEWLRDQDLGANSPGYHGFSALHWAVCCEAPDRRPRYARYLLAAGAAFDGRDDFGKTPLSHSVYWDSVECGRMLLERGADAQVVHRNGTSLFGLARSKKSALLESLVERLAVDCVGGRPIEPAVRDEIDASEDCKRSFEAACRRLRRSLSECTVAGGSITLLAVLEKTVDQLSYCLRDEVSVSLLDRYESLLTPICCSVLKAKLVESSNLYWFKRGVAEIVSESTGYSIDFDHLVVGEISKYFTPKDIEKFVNE